MKYFGKAPETEIMRWLENPHAYPNRPMIAAKKEFHPYKGLLVVSLLDFKCHFCCLEECGRWQLCLFSIVTFHRTEAA
jgi:hypothetical protein